MSWRIKGRRVTMPLPRGRKSRPTMFSNTEDLPEDWEPTTTCDILARTGPRAGEWAHNLREVERIVADGIEDQILQLVDDVEQVLTERRHGEPYACVVGGR